jgi:hypothetical protein
MGFEALAAVVMNVSIIWDILLCDLHVNPTFSEDLVTSIIGVEN